MFRVRALATAFATLLSIVSIQPAAAEAVDVSTVTCQELMKVSESDSANMGVMLWWVLGYAAPAENGTLLDFSTLEKSFGKIEEFCNANPAFGLMTAVETTGAVAAKPTPSALDVSTVKCSAVVEGSDDRVWGAIPWIAGYNASFDEDTSFDISQMESLAQNVGAFCAENPNQGLVTAVRTASDS